MTSFRWELYYEHVFVNAKLLAAHNNYRPRILPVKYLLGFIHVIKEYHITSCKHDILNTYLIQLNPKGFIPSSHLHINIYSVLLVWDTFPTTFSVNRVLQTDTHWRVQSTSNFTSFCFSLSPTLLSVCFRSHSLRRQVFHLFSLETNINLLIFIFQLLVIYK